MITVDWTRLPKHINTQRDRKAFFRYLIEIGVNFHPDTTFSNYVHGTPPRFSFHPDDAARLDRLMEEAFSVRGDVYRSALAALQVWLKEVRP